MNLALRFVEFLLYATKFSCLFSVYCGGLLEKSLIFSYSVRGFRWAFLDFL